MAYEGDVLNQCGVVHFDFSRALVVVVSGSTPCGHMLLYVENDGGFYLHAATGDQHFGTLGFPRYMNESGYQRYLSENSKKEILRKSVSIPDPAAAYLYVENLLSRRRQWAVLPNNCVNFVEEIIAAGGGTWASASNCPVIATQPPLQHQIQEFFQRMPVEILKAYGAPGL